MDTFSVDELRALLLRPPEDRSLSIYMPTFKGGRTDVQQNPILLKNLLREAEARLTNSGMRRPEAARFLSPAEKLLDDDFFKRHQSDGLALFLAPDFFRYYHLPVQFNALVTIGKNFHIKPLLFLLGGNGRFYLLAVSQKETRFYECTRYGFRQIEIAGAMEKSLPDFLGYDERDRQLQFRPHAGSPTGARGSEFLMSHGPEVGDRIKTDILRYFQQVDKNLYHQLLGTENAPLVFAGVEYLFPLYRQANTYRNLLDAGVPGSPDDLPSDVIHARAWEIASSYFETARSEAIRRYRETVGTGRTFQDLASIVNNAYYGRVDLLFVADGVHAWGMFDPNSGSVQVHENEKSCDEDLLDFAAAHTLANRGTVYIMEPDKMPDGAAATVVLRY